MQAMGETVFDVIYLSTVITLGMIMMTKGKGQKEFFCLESWLSRWAAVMRFTWFPVPWPSAPLVWKTILFGSVRENGSLPLP